MTRRRIAALGVLVIIVALTVAFFQVAGDLRVTKRANADQIAELRQAREDRDAARLERIDLRNLVERQSEVLDDIADDTAAPELRKTVAELADLTVRVLNPTAAPAPGTTTVITTPPAAGVPGPAGPAGPAGPRGPSSPSAARPRTTPAPTATPPAVRPCPAEVLQVCLIP